MTPFDLSSGDPIADKRFALARAYETEGDWAVAADLYAQAIEQAPGWVAAHYAEAVAKVQLGDREGARLGFERCLTLDPDDLFGARLKLGWLGGPIPATAPAAYVAGLFDQYAERFDAVLVGTLRYQAPALIVRTLAETGVAAWPEVLDLGCGTGLMAAALAGQAGAIDGVDLSERMVAVAASKGLYRSLEVGDIVDTMDARPAAHLDLVVAADVFCYVGNLSPVLAAAARALRPGGHLAFTVEALDEDAGDDGLWDDDDGSGDPEPSTPNAANDNDAGNDNRLDGDRWDPLVDQDPLQDDEIAAEGGNPEFVLQASMRYAHAVGAVIAKAAAAGLDLVTVTLDVVRLDRGEPIVGAACVFIRTGDIKMNTT
jgi:predicted TPR repeat methyltransferase